MYCTSDFKTCYNNWVFILLLVLTVLHIDCSCGWEVMGWASQSVGCVFNSREQQIVLHHNTLWLPRHHFMFIKYIHHTHPLIYICKWGVHQIHSSYSSTHIHMQVRRSSNTFIILIHSYIYASEAFIKYIHHTHPLIYICKWGVHQIHPSYSLTHIHMQVRRPSNTSIILIHSYTVYICKWGVHQIHPSYSSTHIHMQVRRSSNTFIILIHSYTYASEAFIKYSKRSVCRTSVCRLPHVSRWFPEVPAKLVLYII